MPSIFRSQRELTSSIGKSRRKLRNHPCILRNFLNLTSNGRIQEAVDCLPCLARKGFRLKFKVIVNLIQQCAIGKYVKEGKWIHRHLKMTGSKHPNMFLYNHLINMYLKCGDHEKAREMFDKMGARNMYSWNIMLSGYTKLRMLKAARRLFDKMPERDAVSWNTMMMAYVQSGLFDVALRFYMQLRRSDIGFNEHSFAAIATVCVKRRELCLAKQLHCQVFAVGFLSNLVVSSSIIDAYSKCGELGSARRLFNEMRKRDVLVWTTLVSGHARWGDMKLAREIFDAIPEKNTVSWTAIISGYAQNGMGHEALRMFMHMIIQSMEADQFTFSSCLLACADIISLGIGTQIHSHLITAGMKLNSVVTSSLIDMYGKCGNLETAKRVFDYTANKENVVLWNAMLSALAQHGCGRQAMKIFGNMVRSAVKPDSVTFLVLLNACSHSGLVQEGLHLFKSMTRNYNIIPGQEHHACLIDLLGRSGCFEEVMNHLKKMQCVPQDPVWNSLIGICKIHGNIELGKIAAKHLATVDPESPAAYLLLSSIYAALGKWQDAEKVRRLMNKKKFEKDQACSWIELDTMFQLDNELYSHEKEGTFFLDLLENRSSLNKKG